MQGVAQPGSAVLPQGGPLRVGRYIVEDRIAAGGMATVHIGRLRGVADFSRIVAIKRLLPHFACDPEFEALFMHEARLVARIQHPNVVATLDVVAEAGELILVMDYVTGETLARLMQTASTSGARLPQRIALRIIRDALAGLHAAHEARDRKGNPLDIVHRDISPQNLMVGSDGITRVLDFGIAKAASSVEITREGLVRGKTAYMAPEQLFGETVTRRADIYSLGVMLWEILVGERLFPGGIRPELVNDPDTQILSPRAHGAPVGEALDALVMRALAANATERFETAQEMAEQVAAGFALASREEVATWVQSTAGPGLEQRAKLVARIESADVSLRPPALQAEPLAAQFEDSAPAAALVLVQPAIPKSTPPHPFFSRRAIGVAAIVAGSVGIATALWAETNPGSTAAPVILAPVLQVEPAATPASNVAPAAPLAKGAEPPFRSPGDSSSPEKRADVRAATRAPRAEASRTGAPTPRPSPAPKKGSPRVKAPKAATRPNCTPPYAVDSAGRRHYKPQCF